MSVVTREELIEGSATEFVRAALLGRGYPQDDWKLIESYPYATQKLTINTIAAGFHFDDGGKYAELGSDLRERQHTIEFFVFALSNTWGRNLSNAIKFAFEGVEQGMVPLLDVTDQPDMPIIDYLYLDAVHSARQPVPDPEPWQEFTWLTTLKMTDIYYPS